MNRATFLSFLFFTFFLTVSLSAESHESTVAETKSGKRLAAEGKLSDDAVKFLSTHFYKSEEIIKGDYEQSIPSAIEKAIQNKDESDISRILADLVATTNPTQAETVIKEAKKEITQETQGKDAGKFDTRYVALMERIVWATQNRNGELPEEAKAKDFNTAFKEPYQKARDFNKEANEKLKQAAEGNEEARKWVDRWVRKSTVLSLAEGQRKTGNKGLSDNMIKGVSFKVGDQRVLDMWGPGKEPQRLYLGNSNESATQAIDKFLESKGSFGTNATTRKVLPNDDKLKSWYVDGTGNFTKGAPKGFEPTVTPPREVADTGGGAGGGGTTDFASFQKQVQAVVTAQCAGCHDTRVQGTSVRDLEVFGGPGKAVKLADFPSVFNNPNSQMFTMSSSLKAQFAEFARIQRGAQ